MEASVKQLTPVSAEISVMVGKGEVETEFSKYANEIKTKVRVDGFRPGTAPVDVIRSRFAKEIKAEVSSRLVHQKTAAAIKEKGLKAVGNPSLKEDFRATKQKQWLGQFKLDGSFAFEIETDLEPEVDISNYKGLEVSVSLPSPDKWVAGRVQEIQNQHSEREQVVRPAKAGDELTVLFMATVDGTEVQDEHGGWRTFKLGEAKIFVHNQDLSAKFDAALLEKNPTEGFSFTSDHQEGWPQIKVEGTLQTIIEITIHPINDELAQKAVYEDVPHLMSELRAKAAEEFEKPRKAKLIDSIITKILEANPFPIPASWIDNEMQVVAYRFGLQELPTDPDQLNGLREIAHRSVQQSFILDKIYEKEEAIHLTGKDIETILETEAKKVAKTAPELLTYLKNSGRYEGFVSFIEQQKTVDFLIANAVIKETL